MFKYHLLPKKLTMEPKNGEVWKIFLELHWWILPSLESRGHDELPTQTNQTMHYYKGNF